LPVHNEEWWILVTITRKGKKAKIPPEHYLKLAKPLEQPTPRAITKGDGLGRTPCLENPATMRWIMKRKHRKHVDNIDSDLNHQTEIVRVNVHI
jgi:hypothetical protein